MKAQYTGKLIIAGGNAKTIKGDGTEYLTAIMYLRPWKNTFGGQVLNVCANAEIADCHGPCLNTAGRGKQNNVQNWRMGKTERFWMEREGFMMDLINDLRQFRNECAKLGVKPCVRLNGTSDIRWENIIVDGKSVMEWYPDIQFYDYTKILGRKVKEISNYHLTFSAADGNDKDVEKAIEQGYNVATVFGLKKTQPMPATYQGLPVFNGDDSDLRFLDPKGVVVGLYAKGRAKKDTSGFVKMIPIAKGAYRDWETQDRKSTRLNSSHRL